MADIITLRQKLGQKKNEVGLVGGTIKIVEYDEQEQNVNAHISPQGWNVEINLRRGFEPVTDKRQQAYARKKNIKDGLETLVTHIALHEFAHWSLPFGSERGCPSDLYQGDRITEAVKKGLPKDKQGQASYVANAFMDTIINPRVYEWNKDFSGQVLFWDNEGFACEQKTGQKGFTPFYEAFVKLNMHLWGDNTDRALLKRHYNNESRVDKAVKKVVDELRLPAKIEDTAPLFDRQRWPQMAQAFARNLAELLDEPPSERLSAYAQDGQGQGQSGEGQKPAPGNGIEQKMDSREGKEEVAFGRYKSGDKHSPNFTSFEQLDALYRRLARNIPVKVEAISREQSLPITPLTYRIFDEEIDDPTRIKPSKLISGHEGLDFAYPQHPLVIRARSKVQRKGFPDFKLVMLDNSSSMREAADGSGNVGSTSFIPWGDRSKYHFALLGFYGIENFLQQQGIAQYINHGVSLFSSQTRYKEGDFMHLDQVRRHALNPDWGSTNIDAAALKRSLKGRESFVLSLSDGEIANWDSEKADIKPLIEANHYAHIQLGDRSDFTQDLETWGLPVFYVRKGEDLAKLMVETANDTYRRFTRQ